MANLKEVRNRITSVSSTQQITSAMKMVSAAKLRRAQDAITRLRPYAQKLREVLEEVTAGAEIVDNKFSIIREENNILIIVVTSNRGLCGGFNNNVIRLTQRHVQQNYASQFAKSNVHLITVGKKGNDMLAKQFKVVNNSSHFLNKIEFHEVGGLAQWVMDAFSKGTYDKVEIVYNQFKNAAVQFSVIEQFLPVVSETLHTTDVNPKTTRKDYVFAPSKVEIIEDIIPKTLKTQFYKAVLDSNASEHGARMTSMQKATDNASDLLKELKISYNKARQAIITNEILEIVGGAEALDN